MKRRVRDVAVFGTLGALMFVSKVLLDVLPNIHVIGVFIVAATVVYRVRALYPIYVFVLLCGIYGGFASWWIPYLYVWTVLWAAVMLLPKKLPKKLAPVIYMTVAGLHGLLFGVLYAPAQAIMFGMSAKTTLAWIAAGLPFDAIHGVSNFICGLLIVPLINLLRRLEK